MSDSHHHPHPANPAAPSESHDASNHEHKSMLQKLREKFNKKVTIILLASTLGGSGLVHKIHSWATNGQNNEFRRATANLVADLKALQDYSPGELGALIRQVGGIGGGISVAGDDITAAEELHESLSGNLGADIRGDNGSTSQDEALKKVRASIYDLEARAFADAERELTESVDNFAACVKRGNAPTTLIRKLWLTEGWLENINDRFKTNFAAEDADKVIASIKDLPSVIKHMGRDPILEQRFLQSFGIDPNKPFPQTSPGLGTFQSKADLYHTIARLLDEAQDDTDGTVWGLEKKGLEMLSILLIFALLNAFQTPGTRWAGDVKKIPTKLKNKKNKPKLEQTLKSVEAIKKAADHILVDIKKIDEERDRLLGTLDDDYNYAVSEERHVTTELAAKKTELATLRTEKIRLTSELGALTTTELATKSTELLTLEAEEASLAKELEDLKQRKGWLLRRVGTPGEIAAKEKEVKINARKIEQAQQGGSNPTVSAKAAKEVEIEHNKQEIDGITAEIAALSARLPQIAAAKRAGSVKIQDYQASVRTIEDARHELEHFVHGLDDLIKNLKDGIDPKITNATMMDDPKKAEKELKKMQDELAHVEHLNLVQDALTALATIKRKLGDTSPAPVTIPAPSGHATPAPHGTGSHGTPHP